MAQWPSQIPSTQMHISIVIPAYNEASTIEAVVKACLQQISTIVVVDDGSTDDTAGQLSHFPITVLRNETNQGKGASLWRGMNHALQQGADAVITMDGDGQHCPDDIPMLINMAQQHPHRIVIAARLRLRTAVPRIRRFANAFADFWISWAAGYPIKDSQSGFRLYPKALLGKVKINHGPKHSFVFESELLIEAAGLGFYCTAVIIDSIYKNDARASHYRPAFDTWMIIRMVAYRLLRRSFYPLGLLRALRLLPGPRSF